MYFYKNDINAVTPSRATPGDSGWDFYNLEDVKIHPGEVVRIRTGIVIGLEYAARGFVWDKSSKGAAGLKVLGGVIDLNYVGEINIILANINIYAVLRAIANKTHDLNNVLDNSAITIPKGKAIAQMVFTRVSRVDSLVEVPEEHFKKINSGKFASSRGTKGFGSSDMKPGTITPEQFARLQREMNDGIPKD